MSANKGFDIFISYSWGPKANDVRAFYEQLVKKSFNCWIDTVYMNNGFIDQKMRNGINDSKIFICCLTYEYGNKENTMKELRLASGLKKPILFVIFEDICGLSQDQLLKNFGPVDIYLAGRLYYKSKNFNEILKAIELILSEDDVNSLISPINRNQSGGSNCSGQLVSTATKISKNSSAKYKFPSLTTVFIMFSIIIIPIALEIVLKKRFEPMKNDSNNEFKPIDVTPSTVLPPISPIATNTPDPPTNPPTPPTNPPTPPTNPLDSLNIDQLHSLFSDDLPVFELGMKLLDAHKWKTVMEKEILGHKFIGQTKGRFHTLTRWVFDARFWCPSATTIIGEASEYNSKSGALKEAILRFMKNVQNEKVFTDEQLTQIAQRLSQF